MKKGWVFLLGAITGIILTIAVSFIIVFAGGSSDQTDYTVAEQETEFTIATRFEVFQVLNHGALANCEEEGILHPRFSGPVVYIVADGHNQFYDEQIIEVPTDKKAIQVGTYRYETKVTVKVVPAIKIQ